MPQTPELDPEPVLEVLDGLVTAELQRAAWQVLSGPHWFFGHGSTGETWTRFWKMDLDGIPAFDAIWEHVRPKCEQLAGTRLRVVRQYANGHTYGMGGSSHADDLRPGTFTFLYYPNPEWRDEWDGETVYYDQAGEIVFSVRPRPHRAVFFDSRIPHAGRAPSRQCNGLRVTVAWKLESVSALPTEPSATAEPSVPTEAASASQGPVYISRHLASAAEVRAQLADKLSKLRENLRLPGYQPGQIPDSVIEQRYGKPCRADILKRCAADAAKRAGENLLVASVVAEETAEGDFEFVVTATNLSELPDPAMGELRLEKLIVPESAAGAAVEDLRLQLFDYLDERYQFPLPNALTERELAVLVKAVEPQPGAAADAAARKAQVDELRPIAERRVRIGLVLAELGRRLGIRAASGPELENAVIENLLAGAVVVERPATDDELRDLLAV